LAVLALEKLGIEGILGIANPLFFFNYFAPIPYFLFELLFIIIAPLD